MHRAILFALCVALSPTTMAQEGGNHGVNIERQYRVLKGRKLGAFLAGKFPGKRALILLPAETPAMRGVGEKPHVAVLDGLKAELGGVEIVGVIEPKLPAAVKAALRAGMGGPGGERMIMPENMQWFGVRKLNKELAAYKGKYDILVCLTSLPGVSPMPMGPRKAVPFTELTCWDEKGVSVAIAEGGISKFGSRIESGAICAVVTGKRQIPDADFERPPAKGLDEAFNTRFVLITPENMAKHAEYFPTRR
jgi:hypothetical protein